MAKLTDQAVKAAKPEAHARDITDGTVPGLSLRVTPAGHKSWTLRIKWRGERHRLDLGEYPGTSLADARHLALEARRLAGRGQNPEHAVRPPVSGLTVAAAIDRWLATKRGNRSLGLERRRMELHVTPIIGNDDVRAVTRAQLHALLHDMATAKTGAKPVEANRVYTSLRGLFRWCAEAELRNDDPTALLRKPTKEEPSAVRRREGSEPLLDMGELAKLWSAAPSLPGAVLGDLLRCLLLVPLRREEWTGLRWSERRTNFTADGWHGPALRLPAKRMKGRREAIVPLPSAAVEILEARHKATGSGEYVFAVPGRDSAFAGWRRGADTLRAALGQGLPEKAVRGDWSPHTIRASVATAMVRELGADELLVGRILQHSPRSALGITDTYQRSRRLGEQAALLERWSEHLRAVADALPKDGAALAANVLPMLRANSAAA
ncbi:MAG: integrase arm-type DNA-binding domain-containing protein [Reyranellaceae bacterium]